MKAPGVGLHQEPSPYNASMADYLGIKELVWDDWNREHIGKHDVTTEEAQAAVFSEAVVTPTYKDRFQVIGPTSSGRVLSVIVGQVPGKPGRYYVFSARPASRKERRKIPDEPKDGIS